MSKEEELLDEDYSGVQYPVGPEKTTKLRWW